ncbi:universal stress protein [Methanomicrobium antiquum]|uniref:Universal stress protein n=1 Tax=Methanomicrobium antiquum TaxID=487686 RepID=A0AAF0JM48_9EURY|nr:universal stress protein [Methanomicrobium antiquum]MDD3976822.1 universal stress protein [Methanomicrobium sp.]WFN36071.1 universal stress protein [Methanomicrobium antiquum]
MFSTILVACDGSPQSEKALCAAIDGCMSKHTSLHVVHIMNIKSFSAIESETSYDGVESPHEITRKILEKGKDEAVCMIEDMCGCKNIEYTFHVKRGDPRHAIMDLAEEIGADLIVLGSTGKGLATRVIMGSVSSYISNHSHISTLVVR